MVINRYYFFVIVTLFLNNSLFCPTEELTIIGGGIIGGIEAYYAYKHAMKKNIPLSITIYEKNNSISDTTVSNIVPSLTCDEILSVVPRGKALVQKLKTPFSNPGGIQVVDVKGILESPVAEHFIQEVENYSNDVMGHENRTQALLQLGKMSMDLWQDIYTDPEFKEILDKSNFNRCGEPLKTNRTLHDGYRIDLIYNVADAAARAHVMREDYEKLGYKHCALLSPKEVIALDPSLTQFCTDHSVNGDEWHSNAVALWRPGGCIDAQTLLPLLYDYLKKSMGNNFQIKFGKKVTGVEFTKNSEGNSIIAGLKIEGEVQPILNPDSYYVFCPGETVGTLKKLNLNEPAFAGFAGVSLMLNIEIPPDQLKEFETFNHCMEVHQEGVVLAWQARLRNNQIFIGVAGTKAFYGDQRPTIEQEFARDRNLLQLNMINEVLPQLVSLAFKQNTKGRILTESDLNYLESNKISQRWAGIRSVVYDGFPTMGYVYRENLKVENARCTTHLGSGGGSFAPAVVMMSRRSMDKEYDEFTKQILLYGSALRTAKTITNKN